MFGLSAFPRVRLKIITFLCRFLESLFVLFGLVSGYIILLIQTQFYHTGLALSGFKTTH